MLQTALKRIQNIIMDVILSQFEKQSFVPDLNGKIALDTIDFFFIFEACIHLLKIEAD